MFFFDKEMYEKGLDLQKNMMDQYMDAVDNFTDYFQGGSQKEEKKQTPKNTAEMMFKNAEAINEFLTKSYKDIWKKWSEVWPTTEIYRTEAFKDSVPLMGRFFDSMSVYSKLYEFWTDLAEEAEGHIDDPVGVAREYAEKSEELMKYLTENILKPILSEDMYSLLTSYSELGKTAGVTFGDFMNPWIEKKDAFMECIRKASVGDKEGFIQYAALMADAYQDSFGKLLRTGGVGIVKDKAALNLQMLDSYMRMMLSSFELAVNVQSILRDANTKLWDEYKEVMSDPDRQMTFKDYYDMWIKVNSEAINDFYFTDEFAAFMGEYANNAYDFKMKSDEFMENVLSILPIPTNSEMKSLYKTVYDLRKDVRDLKKETEALRQELGSLKQDTEV